MRFDSVLQLGPIETKDDVTTNISDGYSAEVSAKLVHQFVVGLFVGLYVFGDIGKAKLIEPLFLGVAEGAPAGAVDGYGWCC